MSQTLLLRSGTCLLNGDHLKNNQNALKKRTLKSSSKSVITWLYILELLQISLYKINAAIKS